MGSGKTLSTDAGLQETDSSEGTPATDVRDACPGRHWLADRRRRRWVRPRLAVGLVFVSVVLMIVMIWRSAGYAFPDRLANTEGWQLLACVVPGLIGLGVLSLSRTGRGAAWRRQD